MSKVTHKLLISIPIAALFFLALFLASPLTASAAATTDIKYSPLYEASLQNTLQEFAEKESGAYYERLNEKVAYTVPGAPNIPSYTSSYSCGATCGSTCGSTCGATCGATCGSTCGSTCVGTSTCAGSSTCVGASTCAGSSTCIGMSSCAGSNTCVGTNTCIGTNTCAGMSTCVGSNTCALSSTCIGTSTCSGTSTCALGSGVCTMPGGGGSTDNTSTNDPLPETSGGVKPSVWAEAQVSEAIESGFVPASLQKNYQSNITRQEFCTLVVQFIGEILGTVPEEEESPFTDVDDPSVTLAFSLGIVSGTGGGKFNPSGQISRQEAAKMLTNMAEKGFDIDVSASSSGFDDADQIAGWAKGSVDFVCKHGIMSGVGKNTFACQNPYTREQAIVTVMRMYDSFDL